MLKRISALILPVLALLGGSFGHCKGPESQLPVYDFSKGVDTYHSSLSLPDGFVQDALNVFFDDKGPVTKRQGFTVAFSTKAYQYQAAWSYTDSSNTSWLIVRSSDQITADNLVGSIVKIATTSVNDVVGEVNAFGNAYFVDPTQGVYYWNGTVTTYVSGSPKGSLISQFHGRVFVSGQAVPNGNLLNGSKYLDGTTWATGLNPNDPVQLTIGLNDNFDNVTALYPYLDTLYITKHYSISGLYGFDQTTFQISFLTQECGCIDQQSIQSFNHGLNFMSLRGVEFFDGYTCTRISDPVKNKVDAAIQVGGFTTNSWTQQFQADWNAGTFTPSGNLNSSIAAPSLVLSTFSATENSSAQWSAGSVSSMTVFAGQVQINTNNLGNITNNDFESSFSGNWTTSGTGSSWAQSGTVSGSNCNVTPFSGSELANLAISVGNTATLYMEAVDLNSNVLQQTLISPTACTWNQSSMSSPSNVGKRVKFRFHAVISGAGGGTGDSYITTSDSYIWGGPISFYYNTNEFTFAGQAQRYQIDLVQLGSSTITSGTFTSQVYNTGISSPTFSISAFTYNQNTSAPTIDLQTAPGANSVWTEILTTTSLNAVGNQFVRYTSTVNVTGTDNALTSLASISFGAIASTGSLRTQIHNVGTINSWGNFAVQDALNAGNITFSICSSTNSNMGPPESCGVQTPNAQITIATGSFVQWYATFTVTATTQTPTLQSGTVQWFSGSKATAMASTVWDNRYWLSITTTTSDTANDGILVLNKNGGWTIYDIHAGGLTQYKGSLYHADSLGTGNIYLDNQGYNDNGAAINAYIKTKDYSMGNLTEDDFIDSIWPSMDNLGNFNVSSSYFVDRSTVAYTLSTLNQTEFSNNTSIKLPFPLDSSHQNFGKTLTYKFQASDVNEPWTFYGFREVFHSRPTQ